MDNNPPDTLPLFTPYLTHTGRLRFPVKGNYQGGFSLDVPPKVLDALSKLVNEGRLVFDGVSPRGASYSLPRESDNG